MLCEQCEYTWHNAQNIGMSLSNEGNNEYILLL